MSDNKYLSLLAEKYETTDKVKSELVNLEAILNAGEVVVVGEHLHGSALCLRLQAFSAIE